MSSTTVTARSDIETPAPARYFSVFAGLFLVMAIASVLWLVFLLHSGSNYQEQYNLQLVTGPAHPLSAYGSPDDPMPLYYLLLDGFTHLTAVTLTDARFLSFICLLLSVPAAYAVGSKMSGDKRVGQLAAAFVALSPFILWYGSRATMYALLLLLSLVNQYFFTALLQRPRGRHWIGYILSGLLGLGVHFFFAVILLLQGVFLVLKHRQYRGRIRAGMVACLVGFAVAFLFWLQYSLGSHSFWHSLPYTARPSATNAFIIYVQYLFGFQSVVTTTFIIALWPLLVVLALLGVQKYVRPPVGVQYAVWGAAAPVILMFALGWVAKPLFLTSYLVVAAAPFMLSLSWYLVAFGLRSLNLARNILIVGMLVAFFVQLTNVSLALQEDYLGQSNPNQPAKLITLPSYK